MTITRKLKQGTMALAIAVFVPAAASAGDLFTGGGFEPVAETILENSRGMSAPDCTQACSDLSAHSSGNSANGALSGTNTIDSGAFDGAHGAFNVVQNIGNNVIIQTSLNVVVTEVPAP